MCPCLTKLNSLHFCPFQESSRSLDLNVLKEMECVCKIHHNLKGKHENNIKLREQLEYR